MLKVRAQDVRFLAFMAVFTAMVFSVYREEILGPLLEPLALLTAKVTVALLTWSGIEAVRAGTVISHPGGFAYEIAYTCVGFLPVVCGAAAVLSFPVSLTHRLMGLMIGTPLLLALNFGRLVHLFHVGVHGRGEFDWWHEDLWPGIIRLAIIGLWIAWACWAERSSRRGGVQSSEPHQICRYRRRDLRDEGLRYRTHRSGAGLLGASERGSQMSDLLNEEMGPEPPAYSFRAETIA